MIKEVYIMKSRFIGIDWFCDKCGARLDTQKGFDDSKYLWKCTECGFKSSISRDNIEWDTVNEETKKKLNYNG